MTKLLYISRKKNIHPIGKLWVRVAFFVIVENDSLKKDKILDIFFLRKNKSKL